MGHARLPARLGLLFQKRIFLPLAALSRRMKLQDRFLKILPQDLARSFPRTAEPLAVAEWFGQAFQRQGASLWGKLLTVLLCTYFIGDLAALLLETYIPEPPTARTSVASGSQRQNLTIDDYNIIFVRNLFNSQGLIPGDEAAPPTGEDLGGTPVKSTLPLNLIGTLILRDELRSIATIEDKSASQVFPVRAQDEIPGKAKIVSVEPTRVIFVNTSTGRREYIELPIDLAVSNPQITLGRKTGAKGGGIEQVSPTQFNVSRSEVDVALKDLNQVLTQARAVPNFENGVPSGYKLFQIVPNSIYDKLGLKDGDTICGLNGENINDPGKAFELLGQLKTSSHLELCVKRGGKQSTHSYDIR